MNASACRANKGTFYTDESTARSMTELSALLLEESGNATLESTLASSTGCTFAVPPVEDCAASSLGDVVASFCCCKDEPPLPPLDTASEVPLVSPHSSMTEQNAQNHE
jgi:hypothetical protein